MLAIGGVVECLDIVGDVLEVGALVADDEAGVYLDPERVHGAGHEGRWFSVPGPGLTLPGPQSTPFLFQAGSSPRGLEFAARHAEALFFSGTTPENVRRLTDALPAHLERAGRPFQDSHPHGVEYLTLAGVIVVGPSVLPYGQGAATGEPLTEEQKAALGALHLRKIDLADRVLVVNPGGYLGESTQREIAHARAAGKAVSFTDPV